jgi:hypothetical protein
MKTVLLLTPNEDFKNKNKETKYHTLEGKASQPGTDKLVTLGTTRTIEAHDKKIILNKIIYWNINKQHNLVSPGKLTGKNWRGSEGFARVQDQIHLGAGAGVPLVLSIQNSKRNGTLTD